MKRHFAVKRLIALIQFSLVYLFVFNPWSSFPYTFVIITVTILLVSYLYDGSSKGVGFKSDKSIFLVLRTSVLLFLIVEPIFDFIIQPLINKLTGEVVDYTTFQSLAGDLSSFIKILSNVLLSAAMGEEVLFRGFLFRQFNQILPEFKFKNQTIILISAILFSLPHWYQGLSGLLMTFIFGLFFASVFVIYKYNLWITIVLHALVDTLFLWLAYNNHLGYYNYAYQWLWGCW
nr:type II CAAX endopeptidase family protein [uncultured Carboxylicivirga sp.]